MAKEKVPAWVKKIQSERQKFWEDVYPQYSEKEKIHFWADELFSTMRTQGELTGDPYSGFTKDWFQKMKTHEPQLNSFLKKIVSRLDGEIDSALFFKRIKAEHIPSKSLLEQATERYNELVREISKQPGKIIEFAGAFPVKTYAQYSAASEMDYSSSKLIAKEPKPVYKTKKKK